MTDSAGLHPDTLEKLARSAATMGNVIKAIELARQAILADPTRIGLLDELATVYAKGAVPAQRSPSAPAAAAPAATAPAATAPAATSPAMPAATGAISELPEVDIPLLSALDPEAFKAVVKRMPRLEVGAGDPIITEGEPGACLFILIEGRVAVHRGSQRLAVLSDGDFFGEVALLTAQPRAASVTALEDSRMFTLEHALLSELAKTHPAVLQTARTFAKERLADAALAQSDVFSSLPEPERLDLARRFKLIEAGPGHEVIASGQGKCGLFVVIKGGVVVEGDEGEVARLGPGEVVGEISTLFGTSTTARVQTTDASLLLHLTPDEVDEALDAAPEVRDALFELGQERWALI